MTGRLISATVVEDVDSDNFNKKLKKLIDEINFKNNMEVKVEFVPVVGPFTKFTAMIYEHETK